MNEANLLQSRRTWRFLGAMSLMAMTVVAIVWPQEIRTRDEDSYRPPNGYVCFRADRGPAREGQATITIDGKLDEPAWQAAPWTDDFVDIEGDRKPRPRFRTRAKLVWDDNYLYIGAELEEPHVWATLTVHDSVIFQDPDFEVFFDPDGDTHHYGEFEINALGTGWDLRLTKPYKDGGQADDGWEITGLKSAVHVNGTINDPRDTDRGWTVELAIPWSSVASLADTRAPVRRARRNGAVFEGYEPAEISNLKFEISNPTPIPPRDGDQWRIDFSRVEWQIEIIDGKYQKVPKRPEDNWVWSPQGVINMHRPETWGIVQFSSVPATEATTARPSNKPVFRPDPAGPAKHLLFRAYYAQHAFRKTHDLFAATLDELEQENLTHESLAEPLALELTDSGFRVSARVRRAEGATERWHLREDSLLWRDEK